LQKPFCFDRSEANVEVIAGEEMNQQNLFETNHYGDVARRTDPESSQIAAAEIRPKLGTFQNLFVDRALAWFERLTRGRRRTKSPRATSRFGSGPKSVLGKAICNWVR
jgi:hypothetical protein